MPIRIDPSSAVFDLSRNLHLGAADLNARIAARAELLTDKGAAQGKRMVLCHDDDLAFLIDLMAAWTTGAVVAPLSPSLISEERHRLAARLEPALWIGQLENAPCEVTAPYDVEQAPTPSVAAQRASAAACDNQSTDAIGLILTTSGTTGNPKCVQITNRAVTTRVQLNISHIGRKVLARSLLTLPLHFGHGLIGNALTPLGAGGTLFVGLSPSLNERARLGAVIDAHAISFLSSVPSFWRTVLRLSPKPDNKSLERVHVGSERLPSELWRRIEAWAGAPVFNMYGMTEAANWISGASGQEADYAEGSVGAPWGGRIVTDAQSRTGEAGEILIQTPTLMHSYLDEPGATAAAIGSGWLRTGDTGIVDGDGRLRIVGRIKHQINRAGTKIAAEEIDSLLERHEGIAECCAVPVPDPVSGEKVGVAIVVHEGWRLDADQIVSWCRQRIRPEAVPEAVQFVEALARNSRGKIDRNCVRDQFMASRDTALKTKTAVP